ncbi:MAG: NADPH-dependent FMN reductase [Acidimicrobiia bacterium]
MSTINIAGLSGSLRRGSHNTALLRAAQFLLPADTKLEIVEYGAVPLYNHDVETAEGFPESVEAMRSQLERADAILFAVPEYNWSVPGVLKNAIDWASRRPHTALSGKPAAIMGAGGRLGSANAQQHLRQILTSTNMHVVNRPSVQVSSAGDHFDEDLNLTSERYQSQIERLLQALVDEVELRS